MRVFISWSGNKSNVVAKNLRNWLKLVIQTIDPWMSDDDILPGQRWGASLGSQLSESDVGIVCLTSDNLDSPWILFEAGALAKSLDNSQVIPLLIGIKPLDLPAPLSIFQSVTFNKNGIKKLVDTLRKIDSSSKINDTEFEKIFEQMWPLFDTSILEESTKETPSQSDRDILEELLMLVRASKQRSKTEILDTLKLWKLDFIKEAERLDAIEQNDKRAVSAGVAASRYYDFAGDIDTVIEIIMKLSK